MRLIAVPVGTAQSFEKGSSGPSDEVGAVGRGIARGHPKPLGATRCVSGRSTLVEEGADLEAGFLRNQQTLRLFGSQTINAFTQGRCPSS